MSEMRTCYNDTFNIPTNLPEKDMWAQQSHQWPVKQMSIGIVNSIFFLSSNIQYEMMHFLISMTQEASQNTWTGRDSFRKKYSSEF